MHFEVPKAKSFKEFGGEYLMIVVSIVTALALEHGVQSWHRTHVAEEAVEKINQELRADAEQIARTQEHNEGEIRKLAAIRRELQDGLRDKIEADCWGVAPCIQPEHQVANLASRGL